MIRRDGGYSFFTAGWVEVDRALITRQLDHAVHHQEIGSHHHQAFERHSKPPIPAGAPGGGFRPASAIRPAARLVGPSV